MQKILCLFIGILLLSSCGVQYKQVPYFKNLQDSGVVEEDITNNTTLKIQANDILAITVASLNAEASAIFNLGNTSSLQSNSTVNTSPTTTANGFMVPEDGSIQLPLIGEINVAGLTTSEARMLIQTKLSKYLKEPVVSLRLINFKISVLGDVANPGVYPIQNERVTVADAIGFAGDLTITALRSNILLIREYNGKRQYVRLDLQKKELFNSPYYFLKNNDVIYVQPSNAKFANVDSSYRNVSLILSALSVIALLITQF